MLRFLGRCCLGKVDLLVAGGAAEGKGKGKGKGYTAISASEGS